MNPLIKRVTEKVIGREIRLEDMSTAVIIGDAILEAIKASQHNPNWNLKGGIDVDENTIGNFHVPNSTM